MTRNKARKPSGQDCGPRAGPECRRSVEPGRHSGLVSSIVKHQNKPCALPHGLQFEQLSRQVRQGCTRCQRSARGETPGNRILQEMGTPALVGTLWSSRLIKCFVCSFHTEKGSNRNVKTCYLKINASKAWFPLIRGHGQAWARWRCISRCADFGRTCGES